MTICINCGNKAIFVYLVQENIPYSFRCKKCALARYVVITGHLKIMTLPEYEIKQVLES